MGEGFLDCAAAVGGKSRGSAPPLHFATSAVVAGVGPAYPPLSLCHICAPSNLAGLSLLGSPRFPLQGPVTAAPPEVLEDMERCARALARSVGYVGAGVCGCSADVVVSGTSGMCLSTPSVFACSIIYRQPRAAICATRYMHLTHPFRPLPCRP